MTLNSNGSFTYTPDTNYNGTDSFTYHASDAALNSNTATVTITVNATNDAPVANDDAYSTDEDTTLTVPDYGVLDNDTDPEGDTLTAVLVDDVSHGTLTLNSNGSFTYTPDTNYNGTDSFTYNASDGTLNSNNAIVTITVTPPPSDPTIVSVVSIDYTTEGGNNQDKHLLITVALDGLVADASVSIDVYLEGALYIPYTGTTGTDGTVTFKRPNAPSGYYTTNVTEVTAEGLTWDGNTPENNCTK